MREMEILSDLAMVAWLRKKENAKAKQASRQAMTEDGKRNGREKADSKEKRMSKRDQGDLRVKDAVAIVRMEVEVEILAAKQAEAEAEARRKANKKKRGLDPVAIEGDKVRKTGGKARATSKPKSKGKKHSKGKFQKKRQLKT
jgi:hypothetical protein